MGGICSSEESQFRRADGAFRYLQHSFFSGLLQKKFMVEMGLRKQSPLLSGAVPTIQSPAATKSAGKVLRILFTAQDGSATRTCFTKITPAPTNKLPIGNYVSKSPTRKAQRNN